jgi:hypothetical protein
VDELIKEYQQITQNLLSKLEFQKNTWIALLILMYIGRFVHTEFLACSWKTFDSAKTRNLPEFFFLHYFNEGEAFLHSIVATDETWVYHYESETKCQSMEYQYKYYFFTALKLVLALIHMSSLMLMSVVGSEEKHSVNGVANDSSSFT